MPHQEARRTLPEVIKTAVRATGKNTNALAKAAGVPQPVLHRFLTGERGLTLVTAEKLCAYLNLQLQPLNGPSASATQPVLAASTSG